MRAGLPVPLREDSLQRHHDSGPDPPDLLAHLLGRHAGELHPEVECIGADLAHGRGQPLRHLAGLIGGDV